MGMTREEILKRLEIVDTRIGSADRNIEALLAQKAKSQEEQIWLEHLLEEMPTSETGENQNE